MQPSYLAMSMPDRGLAWLPGADFSGKCGDVPAKRWARQASGTVDLFVHTDGPEGSARYWSVKVGVGSEQRATPVRGVCLTTSTAGWRTLQRYEKGALRWLDDLDGDGRAELVVWDSFPLRDDASSTQYALVAWVYRLVSQDSLAIDWSLSRRLARSIAEHYRLPLAAAAPSLEKLRIEAAEALEGFAHDRCSIRPGRTNPKE